MKKSKNKSEVSLLEQVWARGHRSFVSVAKANLSHSIKTAFPTSSGRGVQLCNSPEVYLEATVSTSLILPLNRLNSVLI